MVTKIMPAEFRDLRPLEEGSPGGLEAGSAIDTKGARTQACTGAATEKAGREVRLVLVVTIRLLLQVEFLSGPRTENSADLAAIDRAFA